MISRLTQSAKSGPIIVILMIVALYSKWVGYIAELSYYKHELTIRAGTLFFLVPMIWHSLWLLNKVRHRSRKVLLLIYILLFIVPNALSAWLYDVPVLFPALCWFCMFLVRKQFLLDNPEGAIKSEKKIAQIAIFFAFCLFSYFFAVHRFNINWGAIFFEDVYEWRFQVSGQRGWLETLMFSSGTKFLLPSVLSYCLYKGRKLMSIAIVLVLIYLFSTSSHKSILFSVFIVCFGHYYLRYGVTVLTALGAMLFLLALSQTIIFDDLLVRRILFLPTYLNRAYYEYFENPLLLSHSIFKWILPYRYTDTLAPAWRIGVEYWGMHVSLNNGALSDGIMNFGVAGGIVYLTAMLWVLNWLIGKLPVYFAPVCFIYLWQAVNSPFVTTFVTHGLVFMLILALIASKCSANE